jgi:hypothetical protein
MDNGTSEYPDQNTDMAAFIERMKVVFEPLKNQFDVLRELYEAGENEHLDDMLDDMAYEALGSNEEFQGNRKLLLADEGRRLRKDKAKQITDRQRELLAMYKQAIAIEAGLPDEAHQSEIELGRQRVREKLDEAEQVRELKNESDVLRALGILTQDTEGRSVFAYPQDLFPESTDAKWHAYLGSVMNHLRETRKLQHGVGSQDEVADADRMRRHAHNTVTQDVHEILGLDQLDQKWNLEQTRNLLAKMRDSRFPTVETSEEAVTAGVVVEGLAKIGLAALKVGVKKPHK